METNGRVGRGERTGAPVLALRFLGVGGAAAEELGAAAAVLERDGAPNLLIDCGPGIPARHLRCYDRRPRAIFITHAHLDHVGGLEQLHTGLALNPPGRPVRLYVPMPVIPLLHDRIGSLRFPLAEGGGNFWDRFQLIPVRAGFWHDDRWFDVFEARHHAPGFAWGLRLAGAFLYTGDTRPIPELLRHYGSAGERLFHDCAWEGNPSHTGWADVEREYEEGLRARMVVYHYESEAAGRRLAAAGAQVARPGARFALPAGGAGTDSGDDGVPGRSGLRLAG